MASTVLEVLSRRNSKGIPSGKRQYYYVSDPEHLRGRVMSKENLTADIVLLHKTRAPPDLDLG